LSLREAISDYVASDFGVRYNPVTECIITVGVSEALDLILRAMLEPGDEVIYHEPCYVAYRSCIAMTHAVPVAVVTREADRFALDPEEVARRITPRTKAILLNFPCNPTGANLTLAQQQAIAELAIKHDLVVITDEIYAELTYGERLPTIAALPGMRERTIFLHGFSKAYAMTGFRLGYACGPHDLIDAMMKIHQYTMLCASILAQEAGLEALRHGRREMEAMKMEYFQRRNLISSRLNAMGLRCVVPEGAFYAFPYIGDTGLNASEFAMRLLKEEKVAVVPGTAFCAESTHYVRCAYANSLPNIEEAMARMARFVGRLKGA
jgi:aminotransferase